MSRGPSRGGGHATPADGACRRRAVSFLRDRGADGIGHRNGTLLEHLTGTERLLRRWGASDALSLAGLCHAAYGTDGFGEVLVPVDERDVLIEVVGPVIEQTVYFYAACDRAAVYPQLGRSHPVLYRDRFTGATFEPSEDRLRDFVDLTLANECEIALVGAASTAAPAWLVELFAQTRERAGPGTRRGVQGLLDPTS